MELARTLRRATALLSVLFAGCADAEVRVAETQLLISIDADPELAARANQLEATLWVETARGWARRSSAALKDHRFPIVLPVIARSDADLEARVEVVIEAYAGAQRLAETRLLTRFRPRAHAWLAATLHACGGDMPICGAPACHAEQCSVCAASGVCEPVIYATPATQRPSSSGASGLGPDAGDAQRPSAPSDSGAPMDSGPAVMRGDAAADAASPGRRDAGLDAGELTVDASSPDADAGAPIPVDPALQLVSKPRLTASRGHTCLIDKSGALWCWGDSSCQVPARSGVFECRAGVDATAQQVPAIAGARVAGVTDTAEPGGYLTGGCSLDAAAALTCWSFVDESGNVAVTSRPHPLGSLSGFVDFAMRDWELCAVDQAGLIHCSDLKVGGPSPVLGISDAVDLELGDSHGCALHKTGVVSCWGHNGDGQLGDGSSESHAEARLVSGLTDVAQLALGLHHSCALLRSGRVRCWGHNEFGQVGDGTRVPRTTPVELTALSDVVQISAKGFHTCALHADRAVSCWGDNSTGQLGGGSAQSLPTPTRVPFVREAAELVVGRHHTCVVDGSDQVTCWGDNDSGQLGDGTKTDSASPVRVRGF